MKLNFYPFHKHSYKVIKWRLVHLQNTFAPASRVLRMKCADCGKEKNVYPKVERDAVWEEENRHLEGYWFGNETMLEEDNLS